MWSFLAESDFEKENPARWLKWVLVSVFVLTGIGLRFIGLRFISNDMREFLIGWYDQLARNGFDELRAPFSNYTPPYLYLLFLMTKTADFLPKVVAIKSLSIFFDFLNSFLVYKILKIKYPKGAIAAVGASAFLLLPTVLLNSAYWGQADAIYTFFLLTCVFFFMKNRPFLAMIFLGISFSFKAQAVFLGPLILLLIVKKKVPWYYLGIVPIVYMLMMIPAALAGRPVFDLLSIYINQADMYQGLSLHAPNPYLLIPHELYSSTIVLVGIVFTIIAVLGWTISYARKLQAVTPQVILWCALFSVALMPFFLPKMHDRYFYPADVLSFLVAFYIPSGWLLAIGYQLVSGLAYSVFLIRSIGTLEPAVAGNILILAVFLNIALMGFIFTNQWKLTNSDVYES